MNQDAPVALQRYYDTLVRTLCRRVDWTFRDFLKATYELLNKDTVILVRRGMTTVFTEDEIFTKTSKELGTFEVEISQKEFRMRMCKLIAVVKQQERGHLEGRSIACCSIPFKIINFIFEELATHWISDVSAVKMTGLRKINTLLSLAGKAGGEKIGLTCDNTKWNECIPISATVMGVRKMFNLLLKDRKINKKDYESIMIFADLYTWMYENKHLSIGKGISKTDHFYSTVEQDPLEFSSLGGIYGQKAKEIEKFLNVEHRSYSMSRGMIMGMTNKMSTLSGYLGIKALFKLQSSDDMCAVFDTSEGDIERYASLLLWANVRLTKSSKDCA